MMVSNLIKMKLKKIFPGLMENRYLYQIYILIFHYTEREHYVHHRAAKTDLKFYVIRPRGNGIEGLMSLFLYILQRIDYADRCGMIPVVDMKNYNSQYYDGEHNVWEWYFTQPSQYNLEDVRNNKTNLVCGYSLRRKMNKDIGSIQSIFDQRLIMSVNKLILRHIDYSDEVKCILDKEIKTVKPKECIGVYLRGTDYTALQPKGEPRQPTVEMVKKQIDAFVEKYGCNRIFLVTEDAGIFKQFCEKDRYEIVLYSADSFIASYDGKDYLAFSGAIKKGKKEAGLDYLVKIALLSKCKYLVTSITRGSISAVYLNGGNYKDIFIFDLGIY